MYLIIAFTLVKLFIVICCISIIFSHM